MPSGTDSVLGWGKIGPPENSYVKTDDGSIIPMGKGLYTLSKVINLLFIFYFKK